MRRLRPERDTAHPVPYQGPARSSSHSQASFGAGPRLPAPLTLRSQQTSGSGLQSPASSLSWWLWPGLAQGLMGLGLGLQEPRRSPRGRAVSFVLKPWCGSWRDREPGQHPLVDGRQGSGGAGLVPRHPHSCNPSPELPFSADNSSPRALVHAPRGPARGSALDELTVAGSLGLPDREPGKG